VNKNVRIGIFDYKPLTSGAEYMILGLMESGYKRIKHVKLPEAEVEIPEILDEIPKTIERRLPDFDYVFVHPGIRAQKGVIALAKQHPEKRIAIVAYSSAMGVRDQFRQQEHKIPLVFSHGHDVTSVVKFMKKHQSKNV